MVDEKGLDPVVADKIGEYVKQESEIAIGANYREQSLKVIQSLENNEQLQSNEMAKQGVQELRLLFDYLDIWKCTPYISIDMSLARGLDYYTGPIWEVVTEGSKPEKLQKKTDDAKSPPKKKSANAEDVEDRSNDPTIGIGSIAAGGRYDELVGMYSKKGKIPCVGISFGVDRIFSIIKSRSVPPRAAEVNVYVMSFGGSGSLRERMEVAATLWEAGITAEFTWKAKPKLPQQFKAAENNGVPYAVILGEDELKQGKVKIKEMGLPEGHPEKDGVLVDISGMVEEIKIRLTNRRLKEEERLAEERKSGEEELKARMGSIQV
jgi:histidyl-tRNA synthetase